jgi:hypothetical protein
VPEILMAEQLLTEDLRWADIDTLRALHPDLTGLTCPSTSDVAAVRPEHAG